MPNLEVDYSSEARRVLTASGIPAALFGYDDPTIAITHIAVEKNPRLRGDMLDILLTTVHEMSHRSTFGGPVLFWNFMRDVNRLSVQNAENNNFEGVRRGTILGLQFWADLPGKHIVLGEALENGMAVRDVRNVYSYLVNAVSTPLPDVSTSQALIPESAPKLSARDERDIRAAKNFEEEVGQRKVFLSTETSTQLTSEINQRLQAKVGNKLGTITPEDLGPHLRSLGDVHNFTIHEIPFFSFLLSRYVAQGIGANKYPASTPEEQLAFGWSLLQEGRLRNPKNAYKLIVEVFGSKKANAILTAREESGSILDALAKIV